MRTAALTLCLLALAIPVAGAEPKISIFANTVETYAQEKGVDLPSAIRTFHEAGIGGFDAFYKDTNMVDFAAGPLKPVNLFGWVDFSSPDGGRAQSEAFVAQAVKYGVPRIMVIPNDFPAGADREAAFRVTVEGLRQLAKKARAKGVTPMIEDYGGTNNPCSYATYLKRYLQEIPELSYALDSGNLHYAGRGEDILDVMRFAEGRIAHVHLKDFVKAGDRTRASVGAGVVPNETIVRAACARGYDGWITLEDLVGEPLDDARRQVGVVREWSAAANGR